MSNFTPPIFVKALAFAADKHRDQRRKGPHSAPYINHPIQLVEVLCIVGGVHDTEVHCAALLHDAIEDTNTTYEEICDAFTKEIADLVWEVTDNTSLPKEARKQGQIDKSPQKSLKAKQISLADKICNLHDLYELPPTDWTRQRQYDYFVWAHQVVEGMRGTNTDLEARFDEVYEEGIQLLLQELGAETPETGR